MPYVKRTDITQNFPKAHSWKLEKMRKASGKKIKLTENYAGYVSLPLLNPQSQAENLYDFKSCKNSTFIK